MAPPSFQFSTASKICFGAGEARKLDQHANFRIPYVLITGSRPDRFGEWIGKLPPANARYSVGREPTVMDLQDAVRIARSTACEQVLAIGGGSVLDLGKAVAALLTNDGTLFRYLEVIGEAQPLEHAAAPWLAVPTTAGTGSEVTRNSVIKSPEHRIKVSLRHDSMLPSVAIVDPELTLTKPRALTMSSGLDALTQLIEPFLSSKATPLTDALAREFIPRAAAALEQYLRNDAGDLAIRSELALASLSSGICLANAGLGAVHGIAGPLGGMIDIPHGVACAVLLPHALETNMKRDAASARYEELARLLTRNAKASVADGLDWVNAMVCDCEFIKLSDYGFAETDLSVLVESARRSSSMKGNPVVLDEKDLRGIVMGAM